MDGQRFDDLARRLAAPRSRRRILKGLAGGLLGAAFGTRPKEAAARREAGPGRRCLIDDNCIDTAHCDEETYTCVCAEGLAPCGKECVDPATAFAADPKNCGACEVRCPSRACRDGVCLKPQGASCAVATECASGSCVDGVCCEAACAGQCEACDARGRCRPVRGAPRGDRPPCAGADSCAGTCDGADRADCAYPGGAPCGPAPGCAGGVETAQGACDGAGNCTPGATRDCGLYRCGATACRTSCGGDADCVGPAYCQGGQCVADKGQGAPCLSAGECATGFCADGYCCDRACAGACEACNVPAAEGACSPLDGAPCDDGNPCTLGATCANGVCAPGPTKDCSGSADACNDGVCSQSTGDCVKQPKAGTPACDDGNPCTGAGTCQDGACVAPTLDDGTACEGDGVCFAGACCHNGPLAGAADTAVCDPTSGTYCCAEGTLCCGASGCCADCFYQQDIGFGSIDGYLYTCCPEAQLCPPRSPANPAPPLCCESTETCIYDRTDVSDRCHRTSLICADGSLCDGPCCGDTCCGGGNCVAGTCRSAGRACWTDGDCFGGERCAGITYDYDIGDENTPAGDVAVAPGVCCAADHVCNLNLDPNEPYPRAYDTCCGNNQVCGVDVNYAVGCCSYSLYLACGTCGADCTPQGGRARF